MAEGNEKSSERLRSVLRDEFGDDKDLMAYCTRVGRNTLDGYISGRNKPNINRMYDLARIVGKHDPYWLAGDTDKDKHYESIVETNRDGFSYSLLDERGKREYRRIKALRELMKISQEEKKANSKYEKERLEAVMIRAKREYEDAQKALEEL